MRLLLCANAASGSGATDQGDVAELLRARGAELRTCDVADLGAPDAPLAAEAARALVGDAQRLVVAGGDGSVGLAASAAAAADVPLAVVATGTASGFARALELPRDREDACALAADPDAAVRPMDLGLAQGRPFVNVASAGLAPEAARAAAPLKPRLGALAYAAGALKAGATEHPVRTRVVVDGVTVHHGRAWQVSVANTGAFGGGAGTGGADPADGALDVAIIPAGNRLALVRRSWAMRRGRLVHEDAVIHARGARIVVRVRPHRFNIDGEACSLAHEAVFEIRPQAFSVVVAP